MNHEVADDCAAALAADPTSADALARTIDAWTEVGDFAGLAAALTGALGALDPSQVGPRIDVLRGLAHVQLRHLNELDEARAAFEELRLYAPDDVRVMEDLLAVYDAQEREEDDEAATALAMTLVEHGELSEPLLRTLERLHYAADNVDAVLQVLQVLRIAGVASTEEIELLETLPGGLPSFQPGSLDDDTATTLLAWDAPSEQLRWAIADATARIEPRDVTDAADPIAASAPIVAGFDALRDAFGLPEAMLRADASLLHGSRLSLGDPLVLTVPSELVEHGNPHVLRFELGRALAQAQPSLRAAAALSAFEFLAFFEAAIDPLVSGRPAPDAALARRIDGWRERIGPRSLPAGTPRVPRSALPSAGEYREFAERVGIRAGVLLSFDSRTSLRRLLDEAEEDVPVGIEELRDLCRRLPSARALVTYVLSSRYLDARQSLGLVLGRAGG